MNTIKNQLIQTSKIAILSLMIGLGVSYASAEYLGPPGGVVPPNCPVNGTNPHPACFTPINVGGSNQVKSGGLNVASLTVTGGSQIGSGLSIGSTLSVTGTSNLNGAVTTGALTATSFRLNNSSAAAGRVLTATDASGNSSWQALPASSGSGTVNTGSATQIAYYAVNGTTISGTSNLTFNNTTKILTVNGGKVTANEFCINADCRTTWPTGGTSQWTTSGSNIYYNTGNVGIGINAPGGKLDVVGETRIRNAAGNWFSIEGAANGQSMRLQSYNLQPLFINQLGNDVIFGGKVDAGGGFVIERRTSDPPSPETGRIWLRTDI